MLDKKNEAIRMWQSALSKMSQAERTKAMLLYQAYLDYGEKGLAIAQDMMDQLRPSHPFFSEAVFTEQLAAAVEASD